MGLDSGLRMGPFSLGFDFMYQFGHRDVIVPTGLAGPSGKTAGSLARADISAWLFDVRGGFQIGPLPSGSASYMFTSGNKARDTTLNDVATSSRWAPIRATSRTGARSCRLWVSTTSAR